MVKARHPPGLLLMAGMYLSWRKTEITLKIPNYVPFIIILNVNFIGGGFVDKAQFRFSFNALAISMLKVSKKCQNKGESLRTWIF